MEEIKNMISEEKREEILEEKRRLPQEIQEGQGVITAKNNRRGFGFLLNEEGLELFFNANGVVKPSFDDLKEGHRVRFMTVDTPKGPKAIGITVI